MLGEDKFIVYVHTNKINNKRYVGWTSLSIQERWNYHLSDVKSGSQRYFHNALRKWGSEDAVWDHSVLEIVASREQAKESEKKWIQELKTYAYDPDHHGYNETLGGDGAVGYRHNEKSRSIIKEKRSRQIMAPRAPETVEKIKIGNRKYFADKPDLCRDRAMRGWITRRENLKRKNTNE